MGSLRASTSHADWVAMRFVASIRARVASVLMLTGCSCVGGGDCGTCVPI